MKFEIWMSIFMALFFAISALLMAVAQIKNGEAADKILDSVINYENAKVVSDIELRQLLMVINRLLIANSQQINQNYGCLGTILAEKMEPFNQTLYEDIKNTCFYGNISLNITYPELNQTMFENPIESYLHEIDNIWHLRRQAIRWQFGSIISFILGMACFIFLVEKKVIDFSMRR